MISLLISLIYSTPRRVYAVGWTLLDTGPVESSVGRAGAHALASYQASFVLASVKAAGSWVGVRPVTGLLPLKLFFL